MTEAAFRWWRYIAVAFLAVMMGCSEGHIPSDVGVVDTSRDVEVTQCTAATDCPLDSPCVMAFCLEGTCVFEPTTGSPCDDGNGCTVDDQCDDTGQCVAGPQVVCSDPASFCELSVCESVAGQPQCVVRAAPDGYKAQDACTEYVCQGGQPLPLRSITTCDGPITACVSGWTCDANFVNPVDGSACRPVNRPDGAPCEGDGTEWIRPSNALAEPGKPSTCSYNVCYRSALGAESQCVDAAKLPGPARSALEKSGVKLSHTCSVEQAASEGLDLACQGYRCVCEGGDCSLEGKPSCYLEPTHDVGEPCDTGNVCEIATCAVEGAGALRCSVDEWVTCDAYPSASCDTWLECHPQLGCPKVMLKNESDAKCKSENVCTIQEESRCAPDEPDADPQSGCVTSWKPEGTPCVLELTNPCVGQARCLPTSKDEWGCLVTDWKCPEAGPCEILTNCIGTCGYSKLNGTYCDDGLACTEQSTCDNGLCVGEQSEGACDDLDPCTTDVCSAYHGGCIHTPIPGCKGSVCELAGEAGDSVSCPVKLFRKDAGTALGVAGRIAFEYDPDAIQISQVAIRSCDKNGGCQWVSLSLANDANNSGEHTLATYPMALSDWNGMGLLFIFPSTKLAPWVSDVKQAGGPIEKGHVVELTVKLLKDLVPGAAPVLGVKEAEVATSAGGRMNGRVEAKDVILCEPTSCPTDTCSDTSSFPDGCGGQMMCLCHSGCPSEGCSVAFDLGEALKAPHRGDIDNDGLVTFNDVDLYRQAAWNAIYGLGPPMSQAFHDACVDLNCDGKIDVADVVRAKLLVIAEIQANWATLADDADNDGFHDRCDTDDDNDGYDDACEWKAGLSSQDPGVSPFACDVPPMCDSGTDQCVTGNDLKIYAPLDEPLVGHCSAACPYDPNFKMCLRDCLHEAMGMSKGCALCEATLQQCISQKCAEPCSVSDSPDCFKCKQSDCFDAFYACSGMEGDCEDGVDNNGNGFVDCLDPSCVMSDPCSSESNKGPCDGQIANAEAYGDYELAAIKCAQTCKLSDVFGACTEVCIQSAISVAPACADCFEVLSSCSLISCYDECEVPGSAACKSCVTDLCVPELQSCAGNALPEPGACVGPVDMAVPLKEAQNVATLCLVGCKWKVDEPDCEEMCLVNATGLSVPCAGCYGTLAECAASVCAAECKEGEAACDTCVNVFCWPVFSACAYGSEN